MQDKDSMRIKYQEIFEKAYELMDQPIIEDNCGELCGYHCCRRIDITGERLGMYLLPLEYEYMQIEKATEHEAHSYLLYDMPPKIKKRHYIYCHEKEGCLRELRPIQCRTFPFEPHIENGEFSLVIEREQIHACPLLGNIAEWRQEFIDGIWNGWLELMRIPIVKYNTLYFSIERIESDNILKQYKDGIWIK